MADYDILINKSNGDDTYDALYPLTHAAIIPLSEETKAKFPSSANIETVQEALEYLSKAACYFGIATVDNVKYMYVYDRNYNLIKRLNLTN